MEFLVCRELRFTVQGHRGMMGARPCRLQLISPRVLSKGVSLPTPHFEKTPEVA